MINGSVSQAPAETVGDIAKGIFEAILETEKGKQRVQRNAPRQSRPSVSTAQREQNRQIQAALNYFNFPAGVVDGIIGSGTRGAIRSYEAVLGFTPDGRLDDLERSFLLGSHHRAQNSSNVAPYNGIMAREGTQGLLKTYRNEQLGIATPSAVPAPQLGSVSDAAPLPSQPSLPSFGADASTATASIAEHCNSISILTNTNGGFVTLATMSDPSFALDEQFCLARTAAVAEAERGMKEIRVVTDAQFIAQCDGLAAFMSPKLAALESEDPAAANAEVRMMLDDSGQSLDQLRLAGRICLGIGYREDKPEVALSSALLMTGADEAAYGEMISHHLRRGFGTQASKPQAEIWMQTTLAAMDAGATPAFLPNQSNERMAIIRAALGGAITPSASAGAALPNFGTSD